MKENLIIKGMHCNSCAKIIKDELLDLGVKVISIDSKTGKTVISYDESKINIETIKSKIKEQGYKV